ncbi:MAG: transcriptional repressor [Clostridiales bacterium]|nr:transcriptional repressor [Clostridiales bacterium]MDD7347523.1 transcriptional repressor [Clostridiales bacterium]MDY4060932.1 transcriptional repressor [Anaerovoracaceae bacterium]
MASKYATRQRAAVLSYMQNKGEAYSSASEIRKGLAEAGEKMGLTTIYRHLKNLEDEGLVVSNKLEGVSWTSYRASGRSGNSVSHGDSSEESSFYLQCEDCGKMVHFQCHEIDHLYQHLKSDHQFSVNPDKTIFYGHCGCKH